MMVFFYPDGSFYSDVVRVYVPNAETPFAGASENSIHRPLLHMTNIKTNYEFAILKSTFSYRGYSELSKMRYKIY